MSHPTPPPASGQRLLRRNRTNRVAAGVCSGLGDYFGVDPVLFRVLFATAAFFGGAGILAYLLAWAAIPDAGTEHAPVDGFIGWVRRRRVPLWLAAVIAGVLLWAVAFSWWSPHHFFPVFPVLVIAVLLVVLYGRREMQATRTAPPGSGPVDLTKGEDVQDESTQPAWPHEARSWFDEAREASRFRRRRAAPIRIAMLVTLVVTLTVLGIIDAVTGIQLQVYFWTTLGIVVVGLLAGLVTRRTPWSMTALLIPAVVGTIAFAGSHASLHDGIGQREWKPTDAPAESYKLAFGQGTLDLRQLPTQSVERHVDITMAAGQVKIIAPRTMNLTVHANIHLGQLQVDGNDFDEHDHSGVGISRTVSPPAGATGTPITVDVHLADGNIAVNRR
jgi:phage shock protein PspC (stress-responsive transcriptional regulator)/FtsH-binding integral membrane protein